MIGYLLLPLAVFIFLLLGYTILLGNFMFLMVILSMLSFLAIGLLVIFASLWEWYFPQVAKLFIANKRGARSIELVVDDAGWGEFFASKKYLPEGLIKYKFGWAFLPRPIKKLFGAMPSIGKPPGRKSKDESKRKEREKQWKQQKQREFELQQSEQKLAENIALKRVQLKGFGKPLWLQYSGLAANFNPYILVPSEAEQDNPHTYFNQFTSYIEEISESLSPDTKKTILEQFEALKQKCEGLRVVLDPRRFKELHPKMYTEDQVDAHGRLHERIGWLNARGLPGGKFLVVLLIALAVIGGIAVVYFMFLKEPQGPPPQASQIVKSLFLYMSEKLSCFLGF